MSSGLSLQIVYEVRLISEDDDFRHSTFDEEFPEAELFFNDCISQVPLAEMDFYDVPIKSKAIDFDNEKKMIGGIQVIKSAEIAFFGEDNERLKTVTVQMITRFLMETEEEKL